MSAIFVSTADQLGIMVKTEAVMLVAGRRLVDRPQNRINLYLAFNVTPAGNTLRIAAALSRRESTGDMLPRSHINLNISAGPGRRMRLSSCCPAAMLMHILSNETCWENRRLFNSALPTKSMIQAIDLAMAPSTPSEGSCK